MEYSVNSLFYSHKLNCWPESSVCQTGGNLTVSAGRLAKSLCPLLRTSVSRLTYTSRKLLSEHGPLGFYHMIDPARYNTHTWTDSNTCAASKKLAKPSFAKAPCQKPPLQTPYQKPPLQTPLPKALFATPLPKAPFATPPTKSPLCKPPCQKPPLQPPPLPKIPFATPLYQKPSLLTLP